MEKVVLAFSGGLDTTYCAVYLKQKGYEVHSVFVNTGGFSLQEEQELEAHAYTLGVKKHITFQAKQTFYEQAVRFMIYGNVLKNNAYPLSVSAERVFQAKAIAEYATKISAEAIAHGSTGAGNDQIRFDMVFHILAANVEIITPIRDQKLSRKQEIEFLKKAGVRSSWQKAQYSINKGLWGTSIGGAETLTSHLDLPISAYPNQTTKTESVSVKLHFNQGDFCGFNQQLFKNPVDAIEALEAYVSPFGIGRDIHVGDTIIGIKGRVGFEAGAAMLIIKAHHLLEKHVLSKWQQHWKEQLANWYGMMLHEGAFLDPVMRNIETFLQQTQECVTGKVSAKLHSGYFRVCGVESKHDLMQASFAQYGEMNNAWSAEEVKGFAKMLANPIKIYQEVNGGNKND